MTRLCLVRHGETQWNIEGRYQGQSNVPLNAAGRSQALALGPQLQQERVVSIYSSDLERARETAEIIGKQLGLKVALDGRLREINQGQWEGELVSTIKASYAQLWTQREIDPATFRPPGGETVAEVAERVFSALDDISQRHPHDHVLIVSHGLALATILCHARGIAVGQAYDWIPKNAEPTWVDWS